MFTHETTDKSKPSPALLSVAAYAFCGDHQEANKIREEYSLPVYLEFLGDHPFTATLMDDLGTSYQALENYGSAIEFLRKALHIRKHSLGNHQVTARSFYDFGKVNIYICKGSLKFSPILRILLVD